MDKHLAISLSATALEGVLGPDSAPPIRTLAPSLLCLGYTLSNNHVWRLAMTSPVGTVNQIHPIGRLRIPVFLFGNFQTKVMESKVGRHGMT